MCRIFYALNQPHMMSKIRRFLAQDAHKPPAIDGHGFAALNPVTNRWQIHKSHKPASTFSATDIFAGYPLVIGHLRNAQIIDVPKEIINGPLSAKMENTHPFYNGNRIFLHNGRIDEAHNSRQWFRKNILPKYWGQIKGNTDSELIFYLLLSTIERREKLLHPFSFKTPPSSEADGCENCPSKIRNGVQNNGCKMHAFNSGAKNECRDCLKTDELYDAVRECFSLLNERFQKYIANFIYANKDYSIVGRLEKNASAKDKQIDTLYMFDTKNKPMFVTEPLDNSSKYKLVEWNTIFIVNNKTGEYRKY